MARKRSSRTRYDTPRTGGSITQTTRTVKTQLGPSYRVNGAEFYKRLGQAIKAAREAGTLPSSGRSTTSKAPRAQTATSAPLIGNTTKDTTGKGKGNLQPAKRASNTPLEDANSRKGPCKQRPKGRYVSKGNGSSKPFAPWCDRKT